VQTLTASLENKVFNASVIICGNLKCHNYGEFKVQTIDAFTEFVCSDCLHKEDFDERLLAEDDFES
jgi:hypothetical protein